MSLRNNWSSKTTKPTKNISISSGEDKTAESKFNDGNSVSEGKSFQGLQFSAGLSESDEMLSDSNSIMGLEKKSSMHLAQRLVEQGKKGQERNVYEFTIGSIPFKLRSSLEPKMVQDLVSMVDGRIQGAMSALKSGSFQSAAVLAALNLAEDLLVIKKQALKEVELLETETRKMAIELEEIRQIQNK